MQNGKVWHVTYLGGRYLGVGEGGGGEDEAFFAYNEYTFNFYLSPLLRKNGNLMGFLKEFLQGLLGKVKLKWLKEGLLAQTGKVTSNY